MNLHNFGHSLSGVGQLIVTGGIASWITVDVVPKWVVGWSFILGALAYAVGKGILIYTGEPGETVCTVAKPTETESTGEAKNPNIGVKLMLFIPLLFLVGCATSFVGKSEQAVKMSFHTVDSFVKFEAQHPELHTKAPGIHDAAQSLRKEAPIAFREAWGFIGWYKLNQTGENSNKVYFAIQLTDKLLMIAETNLVKAKGITP